MKTLENFKIGPERETCIAIGCFDGIHKGHQKVLNCMVETAQRTGLIPAVFTFKDNVKEKFSKKRVPKIVLGELRCELFSQIGVKYLYSVEATEVAHMSPENFVTDILYKRLRARHIFCGFNFRFGKNRAGDTKYLRDICETLNIKVHITEPIYEGKYLISSSLIRECILEGKIELANKMLGRKFSYTLPVLHGSKIGKTIGFPTINQEFPKEFIIPRHGVYKSFVNIENNAYESITNIGTCPTVKKDSVPHSETFIINYPFKNLYNKSVTVILDKFLREEKKFSSISELKFNILNDIKSFNR